ncbi:NAD(P)H-hydrate dehydratase [Edaphobacter sp. 12200R-103]|uniref:NAD(P)H-hydrate dehydratase n=1 Tax=Edaphobacter sp. 12200R-103 TaxID=2703788 RepID=UPI00138CB0A0|nr:NAD(P)H-hydrate dehydratase [Edaphobacter sp. 12200R-103]QHS51813.1 NAD(P)H-hydrate dehydratase [Edaphobacter sp. 12200R-103]
MRVLTAAEMGETDRRTVVEFGVAFGALMEAAGGAVANFARRHYPQARRVVALCGKGNNGGDGMVAARALAAEGVTVDVIILGRVDEVKGQAAEALARLRQETGVPVHEVEDAAGLKLALQDTGVLKTNGQPADLVLDAVVGTGFRPPLRGLAASAQDILNELSTPVIAVDLPSGWDADSVEQSVNGAFRADGVVTFTAPKLAHVFGYMTAGPVVVADIGSPKEAIPAGDGLRWTGGSKSIAEKPRPANSNKGKFGHVLVVGGSYGTAGAPGMASLAALRTGAGLVTAAVPRSIVDVVAGVTPELMVRPLEESPEGAVALSNVEGERLEELMKRMTVLAVGPGLSQRGDAGKVARELLARTTVPMVIDADGLNAFDSQVELLNGEGRTLVLTPHPGEMARLAGLTVREAEADRIGLARKFATEHRLTLVLKGWRTLVAHPDGRIAVNTTGNPAMAKGGSGDILTGIVAAMLAQFPEDVAHAVEAAVYLHGLAADFAARVMDEHTVLATDTVAHLSDAFRYRVKDEDGLSWICGLR